MKKYYCIKCGTEISNYKAKTCTQCHYIKLSKLFKGKGNPMYGKKGKLSPFFLHGGKGRCVDCNKIIDVRAKRCCHCRTKQIWKTSTKIQNRDYSGEKNPRYGSKLSLLTRSKISIGHGGTGIPYENSDYPKEFNSSLKNKIRSRDKFKCQQCGLKQSKQIKKLSVHHIDYNKKNNENNNLISLCPICHAKTKGNRNYWKKFYKELINKKYYDTV